MLLHNICIIYTCIQNIGKRYRNTLDMNDIVLDTMNTLGIAGPKKYNGKNNGKII